MSGDLVKQDLTLGEFIHHIVKNDIDLGITFSLGESLRIKITNPIILELADSLELSIQGETNIISKGLNIDTLFDQYKTTLHLNSREAKQIRDLPSSIRYKELRKEKLKKLEELAELTSYPTITPIATLDEKIDVLQSINPKLIG